MRRGLVVVAALIAAACDSLGGERARTGVERLDGKLVAVAAPGRLSQAAEMDTVESRAVPGLTYHVGQAMRSGFHDYVQATVAVRDGEWFDPDSLSEWADVLDSWSPETPDVAKQLCRELVATGPADAPQRLVNNRLLELHEAHRMILGDSRTAIEHLLRPGAIPAPADSAGWWIVHLWYPHGYGYGGERRITTHFRCTIPRQPGPGHVPQVVAVDSILEPSLTTPKP